MFELAVNETNTIIDRYVNSILDLPIPDNRGKRYYSRLPKHMKLKNVSTKPHIIFIAYYPDPHVLKKALILRLTNNAFTTLLAGCIREDVQIERYFDQYYEYKTFRELAEIVKHSTPHSWHAVYPIYHAAIAINALSDSTRVVTDVNDPIYFMAKDQNLKNLLVEKTVLRKSDYIVHKMTDAPWNVLKDAYKLKTKDSAIISYPHSSFINKPKKKKKKKSPPHVVYAGGIIPYEIAIERGHENHIFDNLIELTGPDTFELSIYVNQNAREMPWEQHKHYFELSRKYKYFHFKKGLPYHEISKRLQRYDAGIFFDNIPKATYNIEHFKYNISSKFFTYLEGGVPIVIYEEAEIMSNIVKTFNIGTVYKACEPQTIIQAIRNIAKNKYDDNIEYFCRKFCMENEVNMLLEAHGL
jgi:hypothetical protein